MYSLLVATNEGNAFFSRTGEYYESVQGLADELVLLNNGVYICELYIPGMEQSDISGMARRQLLNSELIAYVHDCLSVDDFTNGTSAVHYSTRCALLPNIVEFENNPRFLAVQQQAMRFAAAVTASKDVQARGGEGGIIRPFDALWQAGNRSTNLIRVKEKITRDLRCIGWEIGKGKREPFVGKLRFVDSQGREAVAGGGKWFTEANMAEFRTNPDAFIGEVFQLSAMKVNKYGNLREPRVDCQRFDKTEID